MQWKRWERRQRDRHSQSDESRKEKRDYVNEEEKVNATAEAILEDIASQTLFPQPSLEFQEPPLPSDATWREPPSDDEESDEESDDEEEEIARCFSAVGAFTDDYELCRIMLCSARRCVMGAIRKEDGEPVVMLVAKDRHMRQMRYDGVPREVSLLQQVQSHPNVMELLGWQRVEDDLFVMLTPHYINVNFLLGTFDSMYMIAHYLHGLLSGLLHLQERGVAHRDLAPYNLTWDPVSRSLRIIDFDLACQTRASGYRNCYGRDRYSAPEKLRKLYYDDADVYSAGVIFWMMLNNARHCPRREKLDRWVQKNRQRQKKHKELDLLFEMLQFHRQKRITLINALQHEFFRDMETKLETRFTRSVLNKLDQRIQEWAQEEEDDSDSEKEPTEEKQGVGNELENPYQPLSQTEEPICLRPSDLQLLSSAFVALTLQSANPSGSCEEEKPKIEVLASEID